ncbi:MAG TPA: 50S ribosomal protein L32 [Nitrospirae bacterium]|nr:50S ribosomal protein L32 [Nitrospirota bacterium]
MANLTSRHSKSRRDKRRANWKGEYPSLTVCTECKEMKRPHHICPSCGTYDKKKIILVDSK